jgi:hypothetical protein
VASWRYQEGDPSLVEVRATAEQPGGDSGRIVMELTIADDAAGIDERGSVVPA